MARTSSRNHPASYEAIDLAHLLSRLQAQLLSPSADLRLLRQSKYHRARVTANIEYGRTLLLQLETSLPKIKSPARKHELQTELSEQKQLLKALRQRIDELAIEAEMLVEEDATSSEDEDILPTPGESTPERAPSQRGDTTEELPATQVEKEPWGKRDATTREITSYESTSHGSRETDAHQPPRISDTSKQPQSVSSTLRSRHRPTSSTQISHSTAVPTLSTSTIKPSTVPFTSSSSSSAIPAPAFASDPSTSKTHTTETALTTSRLEQDTLTESLLSLATQLKASSQSFQTHLESEKTILSRATEGLDKNTSGLEAAGKKMGMLRRMTEGRGWWGRILMYLWIFGLWIVAVLIVFVGPKLRF